MKVKSAVGRVWCIALVVATTGLLLPALTWAHAEISPKVSLSGELQLYSLTVPTEKSGLTTTKVVMTVPAGFGIDSFVPPPAGWARQLQQSGSGNSALITKVTWTGGKTPTGEESLFQFLAQPASPKTYAFAVQQTYSDGSIVSWTGPQASAAPAPTIEAKTSLGGGGGVSVLSILALIVALLALLAAGLALTTGGSGKQRPLA